MFGPWSNYTGGEDHAEKERPPPERPITPQFPSYYPDHQSNPLTTARRNHVQRQIAKIKTPFHIRRHHIESLNIAYTSNVSLSDLIPSSSSPIPKQAEFSSISDEMLLPNELCYRKIMRIAPPDGQTAPKLSNTYSFYQGLEGMSQYWDASQDNYYSVPTESAPKPVPVERTSSTTMHSLQTPKTVQVYKGRRIGSGAQMPPMYREVVLSGFANITAAKFGCTCKKSTNMQRLTPRLQVGNLLIPVRLAFLVGKVPRDRAEARRGVIEGPVLVLQHREETRFRREDEGVGLGNGEVLDFWRELGGILAAAQLRRREGRKENVPGEGKWWAQKERWGGGSGGKMPHEVPLSENMLVPPPSRQPEMMDLDHNDSDDNKKNKNDEKVKGRENSLLESDTTALLSQTSHLPGQARHDDLLAKTLSTITPKKRPISTTTTPTNPKPNSTNNYRNKNNHHNNKDTPDRAPTPPSTVPFLPTHNHQAELWRDMQPPKPLWDDKITYRAVGRPKDGGWDNVYMFSCVNHHVSILRLRISDAYLDWLEGVDVDVKDGEQQQEDESGQGLAENVLYVDRSPWFDLFVPEERAKAVEGLWGVMAWLCRDETR